VPCITLTDSLLPQTGQERGDVVMPSPILVIRIRGSAGAPWNIEETLSMLRLRRPFNGMIYPNTPAVVGMLRKVQSYITWGEIDQLTLELVMERLRTRNGEKLSDDVTKKVLGMALDELKRGILEGKVYVNKLDNVLSLPLRFHPPRGGFKGKVNAPFGAGGEFGYRGSKISELVKRMV